MAKQKKEKYYTYADFLEWDDNVRAELYDGKILLKTIPLRVHQSIISNMIFQLKNFLKGKKCQVYLGSIVVRFFPKEDNSDDNVFLPDIIVVCDPGKLDDKGCNGPPDLIIEIISPSTAKYDRIYKFRKYQNAGVKEYWIVDPDTKSVQVCILENNRYVLSIYDETEKVPVHVLKKCVIDLTDIFAG